MSKLSALMTLLAIKLMLILVLMLTVGCEQQTSEKKNYLKALADDSGQFALPAKENKINFPQAHSPHKAYRQEWWYLTANLTTQSGESLATQWTLFRRAVDNKHWYFGHAALADKSQHHSAYRNGREELGNIEMSSMPFQARIDDWQWQSTADFLPAKLSYGSTPHITKESKKLVDNWQVQLNLDAASHFFLQGEKGFSRKHHTLNIASHYYSQPFINVTGDVFWQGKWQKITGKAWLDREWGSKMLAPDQEGWDWFSLRLDQDTALMVYGIRSENQDYIYGSIMKNTGEIRTLTSDDIQLIPLKTKISADTATNNSVYPQAFSLTIAQEAIDLTVEIVNNKQIMRFGIEYFEGMVTFSGSHQGEGFLEMTGYQ